jgi:hypothetical protein
MKILSVLAFALLTSNVLADQCVTTVTGRTVCRPGEAAAVNPATGTVETARRYPNGVTTAETSSGAKAAYNPHTGNAATQQTNQNGVKDTQTSAGGQAKTKNGMGVAEAPNGTKCARGANYAGCKPK